MKRHVRVELRWIVSIDVEIPASDESIEHQALQQIDLTYPDFFEILDVEDVEDQND